MNEYCLICGHLNHIENFDVYDGWQCAFCTNNWWIDDYAIINYKILKGGISNKQADLELRLGIPSIVLGSLLSESY